jgi:hypothetical protein
MKEKIIEFCRQILLTITLKESRFSQTKIMIYLIDFTMLIASLIWLKTHATTSTDFCMILGLWLGKGVSSTIASYSNKKIDGEPKGLDAN